MKSMLLLRMIAGGLLVLAALFAGGLQRSAMIILPLSTIFTMAFVIGRANAWLKLMPQAALGGPSTSVKIAANLASTWLVQLILVSLLYLMGRGVAAVFGHQQAATFGQADWLACLALAAIGPGLGIVIVWLEQRQKSDLPTPTADAASYAPSRAEITVLPGAITLDTFFAGRHYSHADSPGETKATSSTMGQHASTGDIAKIQAAETRVGFTLPDALKEIYLHQNGGAIHALCVPKPGIVKHQLFDDLILPFGGYDDLYPCEMLRTVHDSATDYADSAAPDQQDMFPSGCERMLILAQWYRQTLFLDYTQLPAVRVGFVDFDHVDWQARCHWWPSFTEFFRSLRRFQAH